MTTNVQVILRWQDEHLQWSPSEYNRQNRTVFSAHEIWTPDIVLFNSADVAYSQQREHYLLTVHWNGKVEWIFPDVFRSYCDVVISYFPFGTYLIFYTFVYTFLVVYQINKIVPWKFNHGHDHLMNY